MCERPIPHARVRLARLPARVAGAPAKPGLAWRPPGPCLVRP
jgi:hypothetical protein